MPSFYAQPAMLLATLLISVTCKAQEQAVVPSGVASEVTASHSTLLKFGTGLTRGFDWGGSGGLSLPLVLGAEHVVASNWSLYGNAFTGIQVLRPEHLSYSKTPVFRGIGLDAGVRYYYHQAKRAARGRAAGQFVGNYVALHVPTTSIWVLQPNTDAVRIGYKQTAIMGIWGLQRRLGGHGLLDAFAGVGVNNHRVRGYNEATITLQTRRKLGFETEIGLRLSLVK
ncbi:hypothetical protein [Hymenobacter sp. APR13]|uniref:hypothetical protein n=1 Tax=Hymenobacter sp. APR13 TaxID=1356852 RepID=UPI0018CE4042|nr:hypothetical protein [Hymenobacter sp. APR13]